MTKRVKYRKPMRDLRKKIADLFLRSKAKARAGFCTEASALYNEAIGLAHRKGVEVRISSVYGMKRALKACRRSPHGIW